MSAVAAQTGGGNYVGIVPGRVLVDLIMGLWGGFFCLLVVDLVSRFAGLPIPGNVMLPFLVVGFLGFALFGMLILVAKRVTASGAGELLVAGVSFLIALLLVLDATCCLLCRSYRTSPPRALVP